MGLFDGGGLIGGIVGGIGNIIGSKMSADTSQWNTRQQLEWEREKFDKETELANTAHQREVEDLEKAGLNKILTVNNAGASVPNAGSITPTMPDYSGIGRAGESIGQGINTALDVELKRKSAEAQISNIQAQTALMADDLKPGRLKDQTIQKLIKERELSEKMASTEDKKAMHIMAQTAYQEVIEKLKNKDLKWYEADKIINYVLSVIPFYGMGKILKNFGTGIATQGVKRTTNQIIRNKSWEKQGQGTELPMRYHFTKDGILDKSTGEIIPTNNFEGVFYYD